MKGLIEEGSEILQEDGEESILDAGIIVAAQKVEHYEIATYGGLAQVATTLGYDEIASILQTTLEEEKETDQTLTELAENAVNEDAAEEG